MPTQPRRGITPPVTHRLHVIDRTVTPGNAYCYTVFLHRAAGSSRPSASTGLVSVPDASAVPPANALGARPAPTVTVEPLRHAQVRRGRARRRRGARRRARPPDRCAKRPTASRDRLGRVRPTDARVDRQPQLLGPRRPDHDRARVDRHRDRIRGAALDDRRRISSPASPAPAVAPAAARRAPAPPPERSRLPRFWPAAVTRPRAARRRQRRLVAGAAADRAAHRSPTGRSTSTTRTGSRTAPP